MSFNGSSSRVNHPQTLAWEPLDSLHILACPRTPVARVRAIVPDYWLEWLSEHAPNQCCKNSEAMDIEAWWTQQSVKDASDPDLYKFYCAECSRCHVRACIDPLDALGRPVKRPRPKWES